MPVPAVHDVYGDGEEVIYFCVSCFVKVLCQYLLSMTCTEVGSRPLPKKPKELIKEAQQLAVTLVQEGVIKNYEILSLDMLGNALTSFIDMGAVTKSKR